MINSFDRSHKDKQYFINGSTYNCPFCCRGHVSYSVSGSSFFNVSNTKTIYFYLVCCGDDDCKKVSFHLSEYDLARCRQGGFSFPPARKVPYRPAEHTPILDERGNPKN